MKRPLALLGFLGALALTLGAGMYVRAAADPVDDGLPDPKVPGREIAVIEAQGEESSWTTYCEYDARVTLRDQTVVAVDSQGANTSVELGETVVEDFGVEHTVMVYRGEDGLLHFGCAPESVSATE